MTSTSERSTGRIVAILGIAGAVLAGCAQPGQLGHPPLPVPPAAQAPPPVAPAPPGPALLGRGRLDGRVTVRTPGPAEFSVRTVRLAPGESTGWLSRPGTEMSVVTAGSVTVLHGADCTGTRYTDGDALFVPDAQAHLERNDGTVPAELVVTYLLAPGVPDREPAEPAC